jgi:hypothetical protein
MQSGVLQMKTDVEIKPNHTCGYWQSYLEHVEQKRLTLHQLSEIETRFSQGGDCAMSCCT